MLIVLSLLSLICFHLFTFFVFRCFPATFWPNFSHFFFVCHCFHFLPPLFVSQSLPPEMTAEEVRKRHKEKGAKAAGINEMILPCFWAVILKQNWKVLFFVFRKSYMVIWQCCVNDPNEHRYTKQLKMLWWTCKADR